MSDTNKNVSEDIVSRYLVFALTGLFFLYAIWPSSNQTAQELEKQKKEILEEIANQESSILANWQQREKELLKRIEEKEKEFNQKIVTQEKLISAQNQQINEQLAMIQSQKKQIASHGDFIKSQTTKPELANPWEEEKFAVTGKSSLVQLSVDCENNVVVGEPYQCKVTLTAKEQVANLSLTAFVPEGTELLESDPPTQIENDRLSWEYSSLSQGEEKNFSVWLLSQKTSDNGFFCTVKADPVWTPSLIVGEARLAMEKIGPEKIELGQLVSYKVRITNVGNITARQVVFTNTPSSGLQAVAPDLLKRNLGDISPGASQEFDLDFQTLEKGNFCHQTMVKGLNSNEVMSKSCLKIFRKDAKITIVTARSAEVGRESSFDIVVENTGNIDLENLQLKLTEPQKFEVLSWFPEISQERWQIPLLKVGEKQQYTGVYSNSQEETTNIKVLLKAEDLVREAYGSTSWYGKPELEIKVVAPSQSFVDSNLTYQVTISNKGTTVAQNVVLEALIAGRLQLRSSSEVKHVVGKLAIGESKTIDFPVVAKEKGMAITRFTAFANDGLVATEETKTRILLRGAKVSMSFPKEGIVGQAKNVILTIYNTGDVALSDLELAISFPPEIKCLSHQNGQLENQIVTWKIDEIEALDLREYSLLVTGKQEGTFQFEGMVTNEQIQNSTRGEIFWRGIPKLSIKQTVPKKVITGDEFTYEIQIANSGTTTARNVRLQNPLSPKLSTNEGVSTLSSLIGDIAIGETKTERFTLVGKKRGSVTNTVRVSASNSPTLKKSATIKVQARDLEIYLTGNTSGKVGKSEAIRLTVFNTGDIPLKNFPLVLEFGQLELTDAGNGVQKDKEVQWQIEHLNPDEKAIYTLSIVSSKEGKFCITAKTLGLVSKEKQHCLQWIGTPEFEIKNNGPKKALLDQEFRYEFVVKNIGTRVAEDVQLKHPLSLGLSPLDADPKIVHDLGSLAIGESKTISIPVVALQRGVIPHETMVTASNAQSKSISGQVQILTQAFSLDFEFPENAKVNQQANLKVKVVNTGDLPLADIEVVVDIDAQLTQQQPSEGLLENNQLLWSVDLVKSGTTEEITIPITAHKEGSNFVRAAATYEGKEKSANFTTRWEGIPKLELQNPTPEKALVGSKFLYQVDVSNTGTTTARSTVVRLILPKTIFHHSGENQLSFEVGDIHIGETKKVTVPVTAHRKGVAKATITASADKAEKVKTTLKTDLLTKSAKLELIYQPEMELGKDHLVSAVVKNTGDLVIENLELVALLSYNLECVDAGNGVLEKDQIFWHLKNLVPGKEEIVTFTTTSSVEGTHCIDLSCSGDLERAVQECTHWAGVPALQIVQTVPVMTKVGEIFSYKIQVENIGTTTAKSVIIRTKLPSQVRPEKGTEEVSFVIGNLEAQEQQSFEIPVIAKSRGLAKNTVRVSSINAKAQEDKDEIKILDKDLAVTLVSPRGGKVGESKEVTAIFTNTGDLVLEIAEMALILPDDVECLSQKGGVFQDQQVLWKMSNVLPGEKREFGVQVTAKVEGTHYYSLEAVSGELDSTQEGSTSWTP